MTKAVSHGGACREDFDPMRSARSLHRRPGQRAGVHSAPYKRFAGGCESGSRLGLTAVRDDEGDGVAAPEKNFVSRMTI
jgi:hypothetical protein